MENFDRGKFAKELNDARDLGDKGKELAQGLKKEVNKTDEYLASKDKHIQENIKGRAGSVRKELEREIFDQLEWGPTLDKQYAADCENEIDKINQTLGPREKKWRLPTGNEFRMMLIPLESLFEEKDKIDREMSSHLRKDDSSEEGVKIYHELCGEQTKKRKEIQAAYSELLKPFGLDQDKDYWALANRYDKYPAEYLNHNERRVYKGSGGSRNIKLVK